MYNYEGRSVWRSDIYPSLQGQILRARFHSFKHFLDEAVWAIVDIALYSVLIGFAIYQWQVYKLIVK